MEAVSLTIRARILQVVHELIVRLQPHARPSPCDAPHVFRCAVGQYHVGIAAFETVRVYRIGGSAAMRRRAQAIDSAGRSRSRFEDVRRGIPAAADFGDSVEGSTQMKRRV